MRFEQGLAALAPRYDGFVLDMWGVLHDGTRPLPGVIACLERMRAAGKHAVVLSNAPRRADKAMERAVKLGLDPDLFDAVHTSGEETWRRLRDRGGPGADPVHRVLGPRVHYLGQDGDRDILEGLDLVEATVEDADFLLNIGPAPLRETLDDYRATLDAALPRGLPMICANPDLIVKVGDRVAVCAGTLARHYEDGGGAVHYNGKPHAAVYDTCLRMLDGIPRDRILAVGDALHTDVAGAKGAGIDAVLVPGGVHAEALGAEEGALPTREAVDALVAEHGARPDWVLPGLIW